MGLLVLKGIDFTTGNMCLLYIHIYICNIYMYVFHSTHIFSPLDLSHKRRGLPAHGLRGAHRAAADAHCAAGGLQRLPLGGEGCDAAWVGNPGQPWSESTAHSTRLPQQLVPTFNVFLFWARVPLLRWTTEKRIPLFYPLHWRT